MTKGPIMSFTLPGFDQLLALGQGNAEALAKSSAASLQAFESISKAQQAALTRSFGKADAALKSLLAIKSPTELAEWHSHLARQSFEDALEETRALTEVATASVSAVLAPLNRRFADVQATAKAA